MHTIHRFQYEKKIPLNYPKSAAKGFFLGTQERVRHSRGKRAIGVRAIEVLLYKNRTTLVDSSVKHS